MAILLPIITLAKEFKLACCISKTWAMLCIGSAEVREHIFYDLKLSNSCVIYPFGLFIRRYSHSRVWESHNLETA